MVMAKVTSASDKPRLAGRQPSFRGGVLRVTTWSSSRRSTASADSRSSSSGPRTRSISMSITAHRSRTKRAADLQVAEPSALPVTLAAGLTCRLANGEVVEHANLDHGASTPALVAVKQAVDTAVRTYASVHRGKGHASQVSSRFYEAARDEVSRFVGTRGDEDR